MRQNVLRNLCAQQRVYLAHSFYFFSLPHPSIVRASAKMETACCSVCYWTQPFAHRCRICWNELFEVPSSTSKSPNVGCKEDPSGLFDSSPDSHLGRENQELAALARFAGSDSLESWHNAVPTLNHEFQQRSLEFPKEPKPEPEALDTVLAPVTDTTDRLKNTSEGVQSGVGTAAQHASSPDSVESKSTLTRSSEQNDQLSAFFDRLKAYRAQMAPTVTREAEDMVAKCRGGLLQARSESQKPFSPVLR